LKIEVKGSSQDVRRPVREIGGLFRILFFQSPGAMEFSHGLGFNRGGCVASLTCLLAPQLRPSQPGQQIDERGQQRKWRAYSIASAVSDMERISASNPIRHRATGAWPVNLSGQSTNRSAGSASTIQASVKAHSEAYWRMPQLCAREADAETKTGTYSMRLLCRRPRPIFPMISSATVAASNAVI
jgi:hypothetical protein